MKYFFIILGILVALILVKQNASLFDGENKNIDTPEGSIENPSQEEEPLETRPTIKIGGSELYLEIADIDKERVQGLSGRESLDQNTGLLFVFEKEGFYGIWMKDMGFPIDIAWMDKDKTIIHIEKNVSPSTYPKIFYPPSASLYVIETNAGFFEQNGANIGQKASF